MHVALIRKLVAASAIASLTFAGACTSTPPPPFNPTVTFTPKCGSPGDVVRVTASLRPGPASTCEDPYFLVHFSPDVAAPRKSSAQDPLNEACILEVVVPQGASTGPIGAGEPDPDLPQSTDVFTVPCPTAPDAGPEGGSDAGTSGLALEVGFEKEDGGTATAGQVKQTPTGTVVITGSGGSGMVTEVDPTTGAATQTVVPSVLVNAAVRDPGGETLVVGRSGVVPMAARLGPSNQSLWSYTFGGGLERAVDAVSLDASTYLVAYAGNVLVAPKAGTAPTRVSFDTPASARVRAVAALPGGGWVLAEEIERTFPEQDIAVIAMNANGTIKWQKLFANGGRTFLTSLLVLASGGVVVTGATRPAGMTVVPDGWAAQLGPMGVPGFQRIFGTNGSVKIASAVETPTGFRFGGSTGGKLLAIDAGPDGAVLSARQYEMPTSLATGMAQTPSGEIVLTGMTPTSHSYQFLRTGPDLSLVCGPSPFSVPLTITFFTSTLAVTDTTFTPTTAPVAVTPVTITPSPAQPATVRNACN